MSRPDEIVALDLDGDDLDEAERAELHREIEASIAEAEAGDTEDLAKVLARLGWRKSEEQAALEQRLGHSLTPVDDALVKVP